MRFDVDGANRARAIQALVGRNLPPLSLLHGISGVHLCLADQVVSKVETNEKKARADATMVRTWIGLFEGSGVTAVQAAEHALVPEVQQLGATVPEIGIYTLKLTRLKTPRTAG
jgi:hypothetical protein